MRLTRQTNLSIRMLMYCAANEGRLSHVGEIASAYSVSAMHLAQISKPLVDAGLLVTVRGRKGGVRLGRHAGSITLGDVVGAAESGMSAEVARLHQHPETAEEVALEEALKAAFDGFLGALRQHTIADLVNGMPHIRMLLKVA